MRHHVYDVRKSAARIPSAVTEIKQTRSLEKRLRRVLVIPTNCKVTTPNPMVPMSCWV